MKKPILTIFLCLFFAQLFAQEGYKIRRPDASVYEQERYCGRLSTIFANKSKEISFGIEEDGKHNLYFQFNNREWFQSLFKNPKDGIAIDIITKNQFDCDIAILPEEIKGETLRPVYKNHLLQKAEKVQEGFYQVLVGKLPSKYFKKEVEFNMMILNNGYLCRYQTTYNLQSFNYALLDMGLYLDSISYNTDYRNIDGNDRTSSKYKTLRFEIPFKKNKTSFSANDIKPLYDSLRITDFNIKKIDIKAYASVEGSTERNEKLQEQRAESIIKALQTFQKPTIETVVSTSENWVEFLKDIKGTQFDSLKSLSKSQIKETLAENGTTELEPYLKHHRKALISLYLDKIDYYTEFSGDQLIQKFNTAIVAEDLTEAERLQNTLFERMKSKVIDPDLLYEMEIPKQRKFLEFFNSNSAFRYQLDEGNLLTAYWDLHELDELMPNDKKISYNLVALKLKMNHGFQSFPDKEKLLTRINDLKKLGIEKSLVQRMLVNYHIIIAQEHMRKGEYEKKDESVQFILDSYKKISLSDSDYLSLAQFVTYYYDRETAIELIQNEVNRINVDKRLLFYYLNLTLIDEKLTQDSDYRTIMLNAINIDEKRYCKIFDSSEKGGVTFQLLKNDYLRETYCENCEK